MQIYCTWDLSFLPHNWCLLQILTSLKFHIIVPINSRFLQSIIRMMWLYSSRQHRGTTKAFSRQMTTIKMTSDQKDKDKMHRAFSQTATSINICNIMWFKYIHICHFNVYTYNVGYIYSFQLYAFITVSLGLLSLNLSIWERECLFLIFYVLHSIFVSLWLRSGYQSVIGIIINLNILNMTGTWTYLI